MKAPRNTYHVVLNYEHDVLGGEGGVGEGESQLPGCDGGVAEPRANVCAVEEGRPSTAQC